MAAARLARIWQPRSRELDGTTTLVTYILSHTQNHTPVHTLFDYLIPITGRGNNSALGIGKKVRNHYALSYYCNCSLA
ncbi:MAG: hypothetical protein WA667_26845 [Candidatus Nitrosopolaris sp.]